MAIIPRPKLMISIGLTTDSDVGYGGAVVSPDPFAVVPADLSLVSIAVVPSDLALVALVSVAVVSPRAYAASSSFT